MAPHAQDDGFHEIQLNGKQLVFVFMAATVVSVVIFLCGVLVGRDVRNERAATAIMAEATVADDLKADLATPARPPTVVQPGDDPTKAPPPAPPAVDGENGSELAVTREAGAPPPAPAPPPPTEARPAADVRAPARSEPPHVAAVVPMATAPAATGARREAVTPVAAAPDATRAADASTQGWVVQVAAVKTRGEADTLVKRLTAKGYSAFVLSNNASVFRVRVGGYKQKREAETVAARLRKEERINPWVTR